MIIQQQMLYGRYRQLYKKHLDMELVSDYFICFIVLVF